MTDIIKHAECVETYDQRDHPIPSLSHIEVMTEKKGGGADLHIVIAKPLQADDFSLNRLLDKIEAYLAHVLSDDFAARFGAPDPSNTSIVVDIHPDSCDEAFALLEKSKDWVQSNRASLEVTRLDVED